MKTIFVAGLFSDRNQTFSKELCQNFQVISLTSLGFPASREHPYKVLSEIVGQNTPLDLKEFSWEIAQTASFTESSLKRIFPNKNAHFTRNDFEVIYQRASILFTKISSFNNLLSKVHVDAVIVSADYDGDRRPFILEAKKRGVLTLSIEHGFFGTYPSRDIYKDKKGIFLDYASDYVILDHEIDLKAVESRLAPHSKRPKKFLTLGTPHDMSYDETLSQKDALNQLKLDPEKFTITYLGSWMGTRNFSDLFLGQIDEIEALHDFLKGFRDFNQNREIQLIVKLHGPFANVPGLYDQGKRHLEQFALKHEMKIDLILASNIREVLSASDFLVAPCTSSTLWQAFLGNKPSVFWPSSWYVRQFKENFELKQHNFLFENEAILTANSSQEFWKLVEYYLDPHHQIQFKDKAESLKKGWNVVNESALAKSKRICNWISKKLD